MTEGGAEGPELVGVHWLAGVTLAPVEAVLAAVAEVTGESVEVMPRGALGYATRYRVGHVTVLADGQGVQAAAMGCHVEVTGEGCEAVGFSGLRRLHDVLELRASRLDLAVDACPFTPAEVWGAWTAGAVRSKVKVSPDALPGREWRSGEWVSSSTGDTAYLGSKRAARRVRVYDRRATGTRLELQVRHNAAAVIAADVFGVVPEALPGVVLGHVRAFVDFVEGDDLNASRRPLAGWWAAFIGHVSRSRVRLGGVVVDTFEAAAAWLNHQVAPLLAVFEARLGTEAVESLLRRGRGRWAAKHLRLAGGGGPSWAQG